MLFSMYYPEMMYEDFRNEYTDSLWTWKEIKKKNVCIYVTGNVKYQAMYTLFEQFSFARAI